MQINFLQTRRQIQVQNVITEAHDFYEAFLKMVANPANWVPVTISRHGKPVVITLPKTIYGMDLAFEEGAFIEDHVISKGIDPRSIPTRVGLPAAVIDALNLYFQNWNDGNLAAFDSKGARAREALRQWGRRVAA